MLYLGSYDGEGTITGRWSIGPSWSGPFALRLERGQSGGGSDAISLNPRRAD